MSRLLSRGFACSLILAPCGLWAGTANAELGALPTRTDVAGSRPIPEYSPLPIHLGTWTAAPEVTINEGHDNNLYGLSQDPVGDAYLVLSPALDLNSDWGRHALGVSARSALTRYFHHPAQNSDEYSVAARGRLDLPEATVVLGSSWGRAVERRGTNGIALTRDHPSTVQSFTQSIDVARDIGQIGLMFTASRQSQSYSDIVRLDGKTVSQDFRDAHIWSVEIGAGIQPRQDTAFSLTTRFVHNEASAVPGRSSDGFTVQGSGAIDLGLFRAALSVGYLDQRFKGSQFKDFHGFIFRQTSYWYPTTLMTIRLGIDRSLQNSGDPAAGALVATSMRAGIDYELLRNFLIRATVSRTRQRFQDVDRVLVSRTWDVNGEYSFNRSVAITAYARHECRDSSGVTVGQQYCASLVGMALKFRR